MQPEGTSFTRFARIVVLAVGLFCSSCSVYMEATRPTPTDLNEFQTGQTRDSVLERLGAPTNTVTQSDGASCDIYSLYTKGYGAGGKIPIAIAEGAADVFTLGLAEVILTPTEGITKNEKHPITFCYRNQKLVRVTGPGAPAPEEPQLTASSEPLPAAPGSAPSATAAIQSDHPNAASPAEPARSADALAARTQSVKADAAAPAADAWRTPVPVASATPAQGNPPASAQP